VKQNQILTRLCTGNRGNRVEIYCISWG